MYYGQFTCWSDVTDNFCIDFDNQNVVVLFAAYDVPDYEGNAIVVFVKDGKFYLVEGSHCSCYGLEDQWKPEEMPLNALLRMADNGLGMLNSYNTEFKNSLRIVQELGLDDLDSESAQLALKLALG